MRTSLDTNILSALWSNDPGAPGIARRLSEAKQAGAVLISGVVYAELLAYPRAREEFVNDFISQTGIVLDLSFSETVCLRLDAVLPGTQIAAGAQRAARLRVTSREATGPATCWQTSWWAPMPYFRRIVS